MNALTLHSDFHIHTSVSDGEWIPAQILAMSRELGLKQISITDHDAVGAYRHFTSDLAAEARTYGIELIPGIELDAYYQGNELHLLGYGLDPNHSDLCAYLENVQDLRRQRITAQIGLLNQFFGKEVIAASEIFLPHRDTFMKPHLVNKLLANKLFVEYRDAASWLKEHAKVPIKVPKLPVEDAIRLITTAGGRPVLAHPGYLIRELNIDLNDTLRHLIPSGLEGLETDYPYWQTSPAFPTINSEVEMISFLHETAKQHHLWTTRGSDAHTPAQLEYFHGRRQPVFASEPEM